MAVVKQLLAKGIAAQSLSKEYRSAQHSIDISQRDRHMPAIEAHSSVNWR